MSEEAGVSYEARINGRKVQGGGLTSLVGAMAQDLERQVVRAVGSVYCDVHGARPTIRFGAGDRYKIDACCDEAAQRAQAALGA
jgi:hypothetical protein